MKRILSLLAALLFLTTAFASGFDSLFYNKTLRIDVVHAGNSMVQSLFFDEIIEEPYWGGSKTNLIDTFSYGEYKLVVRNMSSNKEIYSRSYTTLFHEWKTTAEAQRLPKAFSESLVMPYPKHKAIIEVYRRTEDGSFQLSFEYVFDPANYFVKKDRRLVYPSFDVQLNGDPAQKVDVVLLPEGYTAEEMDKFREDCKKFTKHLFSYEPFKKHQKAFNIRGIAAPSLESGVDIPADNIWKNTLLDFSFYTFDSERYLMSNDNKKVRDLAANAPYDQIYVLVNTNKYGGGAIYNYYNVSVIDHDMAGPIIVHEFGHGFAGLADEYYTSETSYTDFYNLDIEPWEPNITTLVDFERKWKHLLSPGVPVPTPENNRYIDKVGVFEGAGYVEKGVYRPAYDCLMNSFQGNVFCAVCKEAIEKMIRFYTE